MKLIKTTTSDGVQLSGLISQPSSGRKGVIIHIHGRANNFFSDSYHKVMYTQYPGSDWAYLAGENRGTGSVTVFQTDTGKRCIGNAFEIFEDCIFDIEAWVVKAKSLGYKTIWLQSHSLGSSKVAYYTAHSKPRNISGLIWISPSDELGLVHDPEGHKDHKIMLPEAKTLVKQGKENQLLSHKLWQDFIISAKTYLNFFSKESNTAIFNYNNLGLGWTVVNSLQLPVLAITGTKDDGIVPIMDPHKAMKLLKNELKNSRKAKTIVYEGADHSFKGFERNIVKDVLQFIDSC